MPRTSQSRGTCAYCGVEFGKAAMTRHLESCPRRLETIQAAEASDRPLETLWHLRVQGAYDKDFWLDLEMRGSVSLTNLCADHAEDHPHLNYGEPLPLVNSPRLGMCGYDGPAEPPY